MTDTLRILALELDEVVRAVPGVATVFAADPALVRSVRELTAGEDPVALIAVADESGTLRISASVGVNSDQQAPLTAAAVAAAIRAAVPNGADAEVAVRVTRVTA